MSIWLRTIPAKDSESSAIMAMDPISLAELGLHDADKAVSLDASNAKAYLRQVSSLHERAQPFYALLPSDESTSQDWRRKIFTSISMPCQAT